jgi:hypothetical protein
MGELKLIEKKMSREAKKSSKQEGWKAVAIEWMRFINCLCYPEKGGKYRNEADTFVEDWPCAAKPLLHRALVMSSTMVEGFDAMESSWCFDEWLREKKENRKYPGGYKLFDGGVVKYPKRDGGKRVEHDNVAHMLHLIKLGSIPATDTKVSTYVWKHQIGEA